MNNQHSNYQARKQEAEKFLKMLYGDASPGHCLIWTLAKTKISSWFQATEVANAAEYAVSHGDRANVYVQVPTIDFSKVQQRAKDMDKPESYVQFLRGTEAEVVSLPGLWVDLDIKGDAHAADNLPPTLEDARALLESFPLPFTILNHTGYGVQGFWLFKENWELESSEERARAKELLCRFQNTLRSYADNKGWQVDATADLGRVLRVPGTFNCKDPKHVKLAKTLECHEDRRYNPEDIEQYLVEETTSKSVKFTNSVRTPANVSSNQKPIAEIQPILAGCPWINHCKEDAATLSEPEWYKMISVVARCVDGEETVHEWSEPYPKYSPKETDNKILHALNSPGPSTCKNIEEQCPQFCANCRHKGKLTSPIVLGLPRAPASPSSNSTPSNTASQMVNSILINSPASNFVVPDGYTLSDKGISLTGQPKPFALAPVIITRRFEYIEDESEAFEVSWKRHSKWKSEIVDRQTFKKTNDIQALSSKGFPVNCLNAGQMIKYLEQFEYDNLEQMRVTIVSDKMGWQGKEGELGFLCGRRYFPIDSNETVVEFKGRDIGDDQLANGITTKGSIEEWMKAVKMASDFPRAMMGFYTAFVPAVLPIFDCSNFILDFAAQTSVGKSSSQMLAASVVGNPDVKSSNSIMGTFDNTGVYLERASALLSGIPVILDDTKQVKNSKDFGKILYSLANGRGRGRANLKSMGRTSTWKTVMISSGEVPITSFTNDGGTRGRVLVITGLPFGDRNDQTRVLVQEMKQLLKANYGHAYPLFVEWLIAHRHEWDEWKAAYQIARENLSNLVQNNVAGRLAEYGAAIMVTAMMVHYAFEAAGHPLPWTLSDPVQTLWKEITVEAEDATGEERAMQETWGWISANEHYFFGRHNDANGYGSTPSGGWYGRWDRGDSWTSIGVMPHRLKEFLEKQGFNAREILTRWRDRGWLEVSSNPNDRGFAKKVKLNKDAVNLNMIKREALER